MSHCKTMFVCNGFNELDHDHTNLKSADDLFLNEIEPKDFAFLVSAMNNFCFIKQFTVL